MMNVSEEASHQYAEPRNLRTDPAVLSVRARGVHIAELEGFTSYTPRGPPEAQVDTPLPAVSRRTHLSCSSACSTSLFSFSFQRVFPSTSEVNCSPPALCTGKTGTTLVKLKTTAPPKPLPPGFHSANNNIKPEQITPGVTPQKLYSTCISSVGEVFRQKCRGVPSLARCHLPVPRKGFRGQDCFGAGNDCKDAHQLQ